MLQDPGAPKVPQLHPSHPRSSGSDPPVVELLTLEMVVELTRGYWQTMGVQGGAVASSARLGWVPGGQLMAPVGSGRHSAEPLGAKYPGSHGLHTLGEVAARVLEWVLAGQGVGCPVAGRQ